MYMYVRASHANVSGALDSVVRSKAWARKKGVDAVVCALCLDYATSASMGISIGF